MEMNTDDTTSTFVSVSSQELTLSHILWTVSVHSFALAHEEDFAHRNSSLPLRFIITHTDLRP